MKIKFVVLLFYCFFLLSCSDNPDPVSKKNSDADSDPIIEKNIALNASMQTSPVHEQNALGSFEVSFSSNGKAKACVRADSDSTEFLDFVSVSPNENLAQMSLLNRQFCITDLESNTNYNIQILEGAPIVIGRVTVRSSEILERNFTIASLGADIGFSDNGFILSKGSSKGVPIFTTNIDEIDLSLVRISERSIKDIMQNSNISFKRNLGRWQLDNILQQTGVLVWEGKFTASSLRNVRVEQALPIEKVLENLPEGLFLLVAREAQTKSVKYSQITSQWILNTNMGVSAARYAQGMTVNVRALDTAKPISNAEVDLITRSNDIVFSGKTDSEGTLTLPEPAVRGKQANAPSHLVVRSKKDFSFLALNHAALDLSSLDIGGRVLSNAGDAYLFTDRGIYRPRETVHLTGLVRNKNANTDGVENVELVIHRPNGSVYKKLFPKLGHEASFAQEFKLPADSPRGSWRIDVNTIVAHDTIGSAEIDVQDFIPERLKVDVEKNKDLAKLGDSIETHVIAKFLYGAPASDLGVEAEAVIQTLNKSALREKGAESYSFGDALQPFNKRSMSSYGSRTSITGHSIVTSKASNIVFPSLYDFGAATSPLEISVAIGVQEPGGRTTKVKSKQIVMGNKHLIGVRSLMGDQISSTESAVFNVKQWDQDFSQTSVVSLQWQVQPMYWNWDYDYSARRWRYSKDLSTNIIAKGNVDKFKGNQQIGEIKLPVLSWGSYALTVYDPKSNIYNRRIIRSGWSSNANKSEPDFLEVQAQSKHFKAGEEVDIGVKSPFTGLARLSVWTDREIFAQNLKVTKGDNNYKLNTDASWFPGAYIVIKAFRPTKVDNTNVLSAARYMPVRAMGVIYLDGVSNNRRLLVDLPVKKMFTPRVKESLQIKVPQLAGKKGYAVVQAVDEGILQLTKFRTPNPDLHFFAKRKLGPDFYDDYGKLLRGDGTVGDIRTGSGSTGGSAGGNSLPVVPTKSIVIYSGIIDLDANGNANVPLDLPDFNGSLRTMVTVWTDDSYGAASTEWIVRDPVVSELVLPRYIAPGDTTSGTLILANTTDKPVEIKTNVLSQGGIRLLNQIPNIISLKSGERSQHDIEFRSEETGIGIIEVAVQANNGFSHKRTWEIFSRYAGKGIGLGGELTTITPNINKRVSVNTQSLQKLGRSWVLNVSDEKDFSSADVLVKLFNYPWTCSEQTVSRAGPVMQAYKLDPKYVGTIANSTQSTSAKVWLQSNVDRIISRQSANGAIGLWYEGDRLVGPSLSSYLVDFLVTAELSGFYLPEGSVTRAYSWSYELTQKSRLSDDEKTAVLSSLVKAISPHTKRSVRLARSLADESLAFATSSNKAWRSSGDLLTLSNLAVALHQFGDHERADDLANEINNQINEGKADLANLSYGGYYDTTVSRQAKLAENLFYLKNENALEFWEKATKQYDNYDGNIHEMGSMLRAKVAQASLKPIAVEVNGDHFESNLGSLSIPVSSIIGNSSSVKVKSHSDRPLYAQLYVRAPPKPNTDLTGEPGDFDISRRIFDFKSGKEIYKFKEAKVNDRYIVLLSGRKFGGSGYYSRKILAMIKDPVPAGFQIESIISPNNNTDSFEFLPELSYVNVTEINDDAFFAANFIRGTSNSMNVAYVIRATTPGSYLATQAVMENMYAPKSFGTSDGVPIRVTK